MSLETKVPGYIVIADDPQNIEFATCQLGNEFGSVESASVKRTADIEELEKCGGNLLAVVMKKLRFEMTLKTLFTSDVTAPGLGEKINFPLAGITGRVMGVDVDWEKSGQKMLSIEVSSFDSFVDNYGAGDAYSFSTAGVFAANIDA